MPEPLWQWLLSGVAVLVPLLSLLGLQLAEARKRGQADQRIATLESRAGGLHEALVAERAAREQVCGAWAIRQEKLELLTIKIEGQAREARKKADDALPREVCKVSRCAPTRRDVADSQETPLPDLGPAEGERR